jgi:hypothetical protein
VAAGEAKTSLRSLHELTGETEMRRARRKKHRAAWAPVKDATDGVHIYVVRGCLEGRPDFAMLLPALSSLLRLARQFENAPTTSGGSAFTSTKARRASG